MQMPVLVNQDQDKQLLPSLSLYPSNNSPPCTHWKSYAYTTPCQFLTFYPLYHKQQQY